MGWFKGNIHTHTTNSDGDADPPHVASWYRAHGYDFLVLSDHNHVTVIEEATDRPGEWPLLIPGEEVTVEVNHVPIHVNGLGLRSRVEPILREDVPSTLQANVKAIHDAGGLASINHPNFRWAFDDRAMRSATDAWAFEVFNAHPLCNNAGGGGKPGTEEIWDRLLSAGVRILGVATDDAHVFRGEFTLDRSNPGRAWIMVEAKDCSIPEVMQSLSQGNFYSSTGVVLSELRTSGQEIVVEIEPRLDERFTVVFTGARGRELWRADGNEAHYRPGRFDQYVRATVYSSRGARAWVQPVWVDRS
ncbi:MAG: PHP domain-containing protein [Chloroflexi bacterium]|nr:PHP domain-containing protein [Chloroflexota bacterium]